MSAQERVVGKRILLVDDQQEVRETVRMLLELDAHAVIEARDGREALDLYKNEPFDLVITDYAMPEMQGDELAAAIKQLAPEQPILMISGSAQKAPGWDSSVDAMLSKPFAFETLRQAIVGLCVPTPACPGDALRGCVVR